MHARPAAPNAEAVVSRHGLRSLLLALALACAMLCGGVASASAAEHFASPGASTLAPCTQPDPCALRTAVGKAVQNDRIILASGAYGGLDLPSGEAPGGGVLRLPPGVEFRGAGTTRTRIVFTRNTDQVAVFAQPGTVVSDLKIETQGRVALFAEGAAAIFRVIAQARETQGGVGCALNVNPPVQLIRDTACISRSPRGSGLRISQVGFSGAITRLRNVTAVADGAQSAGIELDIAGGNSRPKFTLDVLSSIAKGAERDIRVFARRDVGCCDDDGADVVVDLENSSYVTTQTFTQPDTGSRATITPNNTRGNLAASPLLIQLIHQAAGSPTIDRGKVDQFSGGLDLDGLQDRNIPVAPDIGADERGPETETNLVCDTPVTRPGASVRCTAEVRSPANALIRGAVRFEGEGTFSPSLCELETIRGGLSTCSTTVTVANLGTPQLFAVAIPTTHEPSFFEFFGLEVRAAHVTQVNLACPETAAAGVAPVEDCRAIVIDRDPNPTVPVGKFVFTADSVGSPGPGFFRFDTCVLQRESPIQAGCAVKYVPTTVGNGLHTITADYVSTGVHLGGPVFDNLNVTAGNRAPTQTTVQCAESNLARVGKPMLCSATVTDPTPAVEPARGAVGLHSDVPAFLSTDSCVLEGGDAGSVKCDFTYIPRTAGSQTLFATYGGNPALAESQGKLRFTAGGELPERTSSATSLSCTPQATAVRGSVRCTVRVTGNNGLAEPTGLVRIGSDGAALAPAPPQCTLVGLGDAVTSQCSFDYSPRKSGSGTHTLTATYQGVESPDPVVSHAPSQGKTQVRVDRVTDMQASCDPSELGLGTPTTCVATVTDTGGGPTPTGAVDFRTAREGQFPQGPSCNLQEVQPSKSSCQVQFVPLQKGRTTLVAAYGGDDDQDGFQRVIAIQVAGAPSTTTLDCTPPSRNPGETTNCVATVTSSTDATPGGRVNFRTDSPGSFDPEASACDLSPLAGTADKASCEIDYTPTGRGSEGTHTLTAIYAGDDKLDLSDGEFALTVPGVDTETAVNCAPDPVVLGGGSTCTVTVTDTATPKTALGGQVNFQSNQDGGFSANPARCTLSETALGTATCQITYIPAAGSEGEHTIAANYRGDEAHDSSSDSFDLSVVGRATVDVRLSCDPVAPRPNQPVACTAIVEGGPSAPRGSVVLSSDRAGAFDPSPECALAQVAGAPSRSTCQVTYIPNEFGRHGLQARYGGDIAHLPGTGAFALDVGRQATAAELECPAKVTSGDPARCTVTVTDANGLTLAGDPVDFTVDPAGKGAFDVNPARCTLAEQNQQLGTATCQISYTPNEPADGAIHEITASYGATAAHEASSDEAVIEINVPGAGEPKHATETTISCVPDGTGLGEETSCLVEVVDLDPNPSSPTGPVTLASDRAGQFSPAQCNLIRFDADRASCEVDFTPAAVGAHRLTATYGGDARHEAGAPGTTVLPVIAERKPTAATVACTPPSVVEGRRTSCAVTVSDLSDQPTAPTGVVDFESEPLGTFPGGAACELSPLGTASATCEVLYSPAAGTLGTHQILASYASGDATHKPASAGTQIDVITVAEGEKNPTTTTLICNPTQVQVKTQAGCLATVTDNSGSERPLNGRIEFEANPAGVLSTTGCNTNGALGRATCEVDFNPDVVGTHAITATFVGDDAHRSSSVSVEIFSFAPGEVRNETSTEISCDPDEVTLGTDTPFTACIATVTDEGDPDRPFSGRIEFRADPDGAFSPRSCEIDGTLGSATCVVTFSPRLAGVNQLAALFVGDANHLASAGNAEVDVLEDDGPGGPGGPDDDPNTNPTQSSLLCAPATVATGVQATCTVTVADTTQTKASLNGDLVDFTVDPAGKGAFDVNPARCVLAQAQVGGPATCEIAYTPAETVNGAVHGISASYRATASHESSGDDFELTVTVGGGGPGGPGEEDDGTSVTCVPDAVETSQASICTATVTDGSATPSVPSGRIAFSTNQTGAFGSAATCVLAPVNQNSASCEVAYTPIAVGPGTHTVTANYGGDGAHPASVGTEEIAVTLEDPARVPTTTALDCAPGQLPANVETNCIATVTDNSATPARPAGQVEFASSRGGRFSNAARCNLTPAATPGTASCNLTYTPTESGTGNHRVFATYSGSQVHRLSQGIVQVTVTEELEPGPGPGPGPGPAPGPGPGQGPGGPGTTPPQPPVTPPIGATPPNTTIKKVKPKKRKGAKRVKKTVVKYRFFSDQPGSAFQCKVDKKAFKPCKSPYKLPKLKKKGRHTLRVRAVNAQGIADPTPAVLKWKVAKKKR